MAKLLQGSNTDTGLQCFFVSLHAVEVELDFCLCQLLQVYVLFCPEQCVSEKNINPCLSRVLSFADMSRKSFPKVLCSKNVLTSGSTSFVSPIANTIQVSPSKTACCFCCFHCMC